MSTALIRCGPWGFIIEDETVSSAVRLAFQLVEGLCGEVQAVLGVGHGMRGGKVKQDHGSLLARPVIELIERAVQAHHSIGGPAGGELAVPEETGQAGRVEEVERGCGSAWPVTRPPSRNGS